MFKELLESLHSELILSCLDDGAIGGDADTVVHDFCHIEEAAKQIGLEMNRSKCEVIGHTDYSRSKFVVNGIRLPETSKSAIILLGRHCQLVSILIQYSQRRDWNCSC